MITLSIGSVSSLTALVMSENTLEKEKRGEKGEKKENGKE